MAEIYIYQDPGCIAEAKVAHDVMGGTERFFVKWGEWLKGKGHLVEGHAGLPPSMKSYDICIHSNVVRDGIKAEKHVLWAGSWHAFGYDKADLTICVSDYFWKKKRWENALVVNAPFDSDVQEVERRPTKGVVMCHSNPCRHIEYTCRIAKRLESENIRYEWNLTGGNSLYSDDFADPDYYCGGSSVRHLGSLSRRVMLEVLASAWIWVYPNFGDDSETFGVAPLEAMAMGIPVALPKREPFISCDIFRDLAVVCDDVDVMSDWVVGMMREEDPPVICCDPVLERYRDKYIFGILDGILERLFYRSELEKK